MTSFNIAAGTETAQQYLASGETGRIGSGANLSTGTDTAIFVNPAINGVFNGTLANPTIDNAGTITAGNDALYLEAPFSGTVYIRNTGTIVSTNRQVMVTFTEGGAIVFDNGGTLTSQTARTLEFGSSDDILVLRAGSSMSGFAQGGAGTDTLYYGLWTGTGVTVTLEGAASGTNGVQAFENVYGSAQGDSITGASGANVLVGLDGNDLLSGQDGNDTLWGGNGNDTMAGGNDNDLFYGGTGNDSMVGGTGNDIYQVTDAGDVVIENAGEGTDTVFATVSWTVTSLNIETIYAVGSGLTLTGSSGPDTLVADATAGSTLRGGSGTDTLWGQAGADSLSGGAASDTLRGGAGNDTLSGDAGDDQLVGGSGADTFAFAAPNWGHDQLFDFSRAEGDKIDMRGSGITSLAGFAAVQEISGNSQLVAADGSIIDIYGFTGLIASDFIFS